MTARLMTADFRERSRRPAYAVVLLAAVALGVVALPATRSHWQIFQLGDYRGVYSSAYAGTVTALAGAVWLSLAGFYVVKNAVALDVDTGVGQILAATPLRRAPYLIGKFAASVAVLGSMTAALAVTALVMQLWRGEDRHVAPVALIAPFVLITLPVLALTAAAAVLFETVPALRSGTGNIVWLFLWTTGTIGLQSGGGLDVYGLGHVIASMRADLPSRHPFDFGVGLVERDSPLKVFSWSGSYVDAGFLAQRVALVTLAVALATAGALWFHRFDPSRATPRRHRPAAAEPATRWTHAAARPATPARSGPAPLRLPRTSPRVLLAGVSPWWWSVTVLLNLIAAVVPAHNVAPAMLPLCWAWPVLLWSRLGTQETADDLSGLLSAYPRRHSRLLATWLAGVVLTAAAAAVPLVRLTVAGHGTAGVLFIPALALFLGTVTRSPRPFQVIYLLWWYAILNGGQSINFMSSPGLDPAVTAAGAVALVLGVAGWQEVRHARR